MHSTVRRSFYLVLIICVTSLLSVGTILLVNKSLTQTISAESNHVTFEDTFNDQLYLINNLEAHKESSIAFDIYTPTSREITLIANQLYYPHEIYINNELVSQNISSDLPCFNPKMSFKTFILHPDTPSTSFRIEVEGSHTSTYFLASSTYMDRYTDMRLLLNSILFTSNLLIVFFILFFISYYPEKKLLLIFAFCSILCAVKITFFENFFLFFPSPRWFGVNMMFTTSLITILPLYLMAYMFETPYKRYINILLLVLGIILLNTYGAGFPRNDFISWFSLFLVISCYLYILGYAYYQQKPYAITALILSITFICASLFHILLLYGSTKIPFTLSFYINLSYFATVLQMYGVLILFIKQMIDKAKAYDNMLLLRGIGHDLSSPLSVLQLNLQMLENYELNQEQKKLIFKTSYTAFNHLKSMVSNINIYCNKGVIYSESMTVSLQTCLKELNDYYCSLNDYQLHITTSKEDIFLPTSSDILGRVLYNLVDNAFKYSPGGSPVTVSYFIKHKRVHLLVADQGIGMDQQEAKKVFDLFYKANKSRTEPGLGIGMNIVKHIVDSLGGKIIIHSQKNVGTTVTLILPYTKNTL